MADTAWLPLSWDRLLPFGKERGGEVAMIQG